MAVHSNLGKPTRMFAVRGRKSSISSEDVGVGHRQLFKKNITFFKAICPPIRFMPIKEIDA